MRSFTVAAVVVLVVSGLVNQVGCARDGAKEKINAYLEKHVESEDVGANLAAAEEYLRELKQKTHIFGSERVDLLEGLLSMKAALNQCNEESFLAFYDLLDEWSITGRVQQVVKQAKEIEHPKNCLPELRQQVVSKVASIEPKALTQMKGYTDNVIKHIQTIRPGESLRDLLQRDAVPTRDSIYNSDMLAFAQNQQQVDEPQSVGSKSARQVIEKYIIEPCELYTIKLSAVRPLWTQLIQSKVEIDEDLITDIYRFAICDYIRKDERLFV